MKNKTRLLMVAACVAGMLLTGCGGSQPTTAAPAESEKAPVEQQVSEEQEEVVESEASEPAAGMDLSAAPAGTYVIATQGVSGASYTRLAAFAEATSKLLPEQTMLEQSPISPGGIASIILVQNGEAQIASGNNTPAKRLYESTYRDFDNCPDIRAIAGATSYNYMIMMFTDEFVQKTGYSTFEEIIENKYPVKIVTKAPGGTGEMTASDYLDCFGVTYDDIKSWGGDVFQVDLNQMADMLKEGTADVSVDSLSIGQASMTELCLTTTMHLTGPGPEATQKMVDLGYFKIDLPAGSFNGQDEVMPTVGLCETIICTADLPDEVAYAFAKALCEDNGDIAAQIPTFGTDFDPVLACDPSYLGCPLHPGAEAYYKEAGFLK